MDYKEYYKALNTQLAERIEGLATHLLGEPIDKTAKSWRFGKKREILISVLGTQRGRFWNFETGEGGGALDLVAKTLQLSGKELCRWSKNWLGTEKIVVESNAKEEIVWTPIFPIPSSAENPKFSEAPLSAFLAERTIEMMYPYRRQDGLLLGYTVRIQDPEVGKIVPMLTYCQSSTGDTSWRWKGFGDNRPLYGLDLFAQNPDKPVLIVEGEKTADAARELFKDYVVVTWSGGANCVLKTDWSVLAGREVVIWPDNDAAGKKAAVVLQTFLKSSLKLEAKIVTIPDHLPAGWDLADKADFNVRELLG